MDGQRGRRGRPRWVKFGCPATAVLGWVGHHYSLGFGMALFGGTYGLGAIAIFIARAIFYRRDAIKE